MQNAKPITIIYTAKNERMNLAKFLSCNVKYSDIAKVIVVDDGSTDDTSKVAKSFSQYFEISVIKNQKSMGHVYGWDQGARAADTEFIWLIAADMEYVGLEHVLAHFRDQKTVQVLPKLVYMPAENLVQRMEEIYFMCALQNPFIKEKISERIYPYSHAVMRKSFYLEVNPPTNMGSGEEHRFARLASPIIAQKDYKLVFEEKLLFRQKMLDSCKSYLVQQRFYGRGSPTTFLYNDFPRSYQRFIRFSLICAVFFYLAGASLFFYLSLILTVGRFVVGFLSLGNKSGLFPSANKHVQLFYPLGFVWMLLGDIAYFYGMCESILHKIFAGKWLATR